MQYTSHVYSALCASHSHSYVKLAVICTVGLMLMAVLPGVQTLWVGVVWEEFVITSIDFLPTSKVKLAVKTRRPLLPKRPGGRSLLRDA